MISAAELANKKFTGIDLPEPYLTVLGKVPKNFSMAIWGPAGSGKSTVAVDLAKVLVDSLGKGIYCSSEEGAGPSMQSKIKRLKADHKDLFVMDFDGMEDLKSAIKYSGAKFCIFDSASMSHIKVADMESIHDFCKDNNIAFLYILHATKAGDFKGNSYLIHMPDTVLKVQDGIAKTEKNRFADTPQEFEVRFEVDERETPSNNKYTRINPNDPEYYGIDFIESEFQEDLRENKAPSPDELYETITEQILELIESGEELPWQKPWNSKRNFPHSLPTNFVSKKAYRGINRLLLMFTRIVKDDEGKKVRVLGGFDHPYYLTSKQIDRLGGRIKEGAVGQYAFYFNVLYAYDQEDPELDFSTTDKKKFIQWAERNWNQISIDEIEGKTPKEFAESHTYPLLRYYNIFNGSDIEGIDFGELPAPKELPESERLKAGELIVENYPNPPEIEFGGDQPAYFPKQDKIRMTEFKQFKDAQKYYSVFFHELSHSTGHSSRLDRGNDTRVRDGSDEDKKAYKFEELVAEMSAAFLCAEAGILFHTREMTAAYLKGYKQALARYMGDDDKFFFRATSRAQAATDYILDRDEQGVPAYRKDLNIEAVETESEAEILSDELTQEDFKADIPYQLAYDAYSNSSFSPDKRAKAAIDEYADELHGIYQEFMKAEDKEAAKQEFERYHKKAKDLYTDILRTRTGIASSFVVGPANFPVKKMEKRLESERKKTEKYLDFTSRVKNKVLKKLGVIEGSQDIISGSDGAIDQLKAKIKELEDEREKIKTINKLIRKDDDEGLKELGLSDDQIKKLKEPDFAGRKGFPPYVLKNLGANIRRYKKRLEAEEKKAKRAEDGNVEIQVEGATIVENFDDNRLQIFFDSKPEKEVRDELKSNGFRWAPSKKAWQRQLTNNARHAVKRVFPELYNQDKKPKAETTESKAESKYEIGDYVLLKSGREGEITDIKDVDFTELDQLAHFGKQKGYLIEGNGIYVPASSIVKKLDKTPDSLPTAETDAFDSAEIAIDMADYLLWQKGKQVKYDPELVVNNFFNTKEKTDYLAGLPVYKERKDSPDAYKAYKKNFDSVTPDKVIEIVKAKVKDQKAGEAALDENSEGATVDIYFKTDKPVTGRYDIIEAKDLIPSHNKDCSQNSKHLISKAQPRDRSGEDLCNQSKLMAQKLNPDLITVGNKAFDGAPVTLPDGQVIQGNGRSIALKIAYDEFEKQADKYRNYLLKNASNFGLSRDYVDGFNQPVLVRKVDVSEKEAVSLGNIVDTSQAKMNRLDQAKAYIRQLDEQKRQIIGRIINSSSGETLGEIIDDKGLMILDQLKDLDRTGLVQNNALTSDGKDFLKQLFAGLVFDSDKNKDALKHFAKLLHNTKAGIERSYGFIIPFIGSERDIAPTLQKSIEIVQAIQNSEAIDTIPDFLAQGDAFTGINRDRFSEKEVQLAEFLLPQSTQKAIKEAFQVYYFKNIGRNDLLNPVEKVSPDQAFQEAFVEQVRINPPEELVKLYTPAEFKKGDVVRDYYDNVKYEMTSKRKGTYYFKNLKTGKREKFRKSDKRFLRNRDVTPTLSLFRENPGTLAYMGITERVTIEDGNGGKELQGEFPTFLSGDKLYIIPKNRVKKVKNQVDDSEAVEAFEEFNNYNASDVDYKIDFPEEKAVAVGSADKIWYASDKVIQPGDKKGKLNHYVHEFDPGKRPAVVKGDVLVIGNIEWDARGLLN